MSMSGKIYTTYVYPPIPLRNYDWSAVRDNYDEGGCIGWGTTEDEAIADLLEMEQDLEK